MGQNKNLVVKHNDLVEARHELSLNEQKMILFTVSKLDRKSEDFTTVAIKASDFSDLLGLDQTSYNQIEATADNLVKNPIKIKSDDGGWISTTWLSGARYIPQKGILEMEFSKYLKPYLLKLKEKFTQYELENIINLQSKHSIKLYELLKQYQSIKTREFNLEEFRSLMGLENTYENVTNIEHHIIKPSLEEINEKTDISISYDKLHKKAKGNPICGYKFYIDSKDVDRKKWVEYLKETLDLRELESQLGVESEGFSPVQLSNLYDLAVKKTQGEGLSPFQYTILNYSYIKNKEENIRNMYGYLMKALEEDFAQAGLLLKLQQDMGK